MKRLAIIALAAALAGGGCSCSTLTLVSVDGRPYDGISALVAAAPKEGDVPDASIYEMFQPDARTEFEVARGATELPPNLFRELLSVLTLGVIPIREDRIRRYRFVYASKDEPLDVARIEVRCCAHGGWLPTAWLPPTLSADRYSWDGLYENRAYHDRKAYLASVCELVWRLRNGGNR